MHAKCEKSVSLRLGVDRNDRLAAETGATIELCHVVLAVQTLSKQSYCECMWFFPGW